MMTARLAAEVMFLTREFERLNNNLSDHLDAQFFATVLGRRARLLRQYGGVQTWTQLHARALGYLDRVHEELKRVGASYYAPYMQFENIIWSRS